MWFKHFLVIKSSHFVRLLAVQCTVKKYLNCMNFYIPPRYGYYESMTNSFRPLFWSPSINYRASPYITLWVRVCIGEALVLPGLTSVNYTQPPKYATQLDDLLCSMDFYTSSKICLQNIIHFKGCLLTYQLITKWADLDYTNIAHFALTWYLGI